jgi:hypothetical protein
VGLTGCGKTNHIDLIVMERQVSGLASQQVSGFVLKLAETRFLLELGYGRISLFPCLGASCWRK